jgi:hypothetical protein
MNKDVIEKIISNKGTVLIFIDDSGEVMMLTTGDITDEQLKFVTKVTTIIDEHSFVLKFVLFLEIFFNNMLFRLGKFFNR